MPKAVRLKKTMSLREFYDKRNQVMIQMTYGGLGDVLMHRMLFEDIKKLMPEAEIHFACPKHYHDAISDHPFLDQLWDCNDAFSQEFVVHYNTTKVAIQYETRIAPLADKHRADIWAEHCGLSLTDHDMHIRLTEEERREGRQILETHRDRQGLKVLLAPISSMQNKNLTPQMIEEVCQGLHNRKMYVSVLHSERMKTSVPLITGLNLRQWLAVIHEADVLISVDTAQFHAGGGMRKPTVGVFTYVDGYVYSRYYPTATIVQLHRDTHPEWTCGPCYNFRACPKCRTNPKPCVTELTSDMILRGFDSLFL